MPEPPSQKILNPRNWQNVTKRRFSYLLLCHDKCGYIVRYRNLYFTPLQILERNSQHTIHTLVNMMCPLLFRLVKGQRMRAQNARTDSEWINNGSYDFCSLEKWSFIIGHGTIITKSHCENAHHWFLIGFRIPSVMLYCKSLYTAKNIFKKRLNHESWYILLMRKTTWEKKSCFKTKYMKFQISICASKQAKKICNPNIKFSD